MMLHLKLAPAVLMLASTALGCSVQFNGVGNLKASKTSQLEVKASAAPELIVDSRNGSIEVTPGDDDKVSVEAEARADTDEDLAKIEVSARAEGNVVRVDWSTTDKVHNNRQVSFKIRAPKGSTLTLKTRAGSIDVARFSKGLDAITGAGSIEVEDVVGDLDLVSRAGSIEVKGGKGSVKADSRAGSVKLEGDFTGDCVADSGAGQVQVRLPSSSQLKIDASTGAGSASNGFGWKVSGTVGRKMSGTLGDGSGGTFKIHSGAGSVSVDKAK